MNEILNKLSDRLELIKYVTVNDLPDVPDKNTVYFLQQDWTYIDNKWIRIDGGVE